MTLPDPSFIFVEGDEEICTVTNGDNETKSELQSSHEEECELNEKSFPWFIQRIEARLSFIKSGLYPFTSVTIPSYTDQTLIHVICAEDTHPKRDVTLLVSSFSDFENQILKSFPLLHGESTPEDAASYFQSLVGNNVDDDGFDGYGDWQIEDGGDKKEEEKGIIEFSIGKKTQEDVRTASFINFLLVIISKLLYTFSSIMKKLQLSAKSIMIVEEHAKTFQNLPKVPIGDESFKELQNFAEFTDMLQYASKDPNGVFQLFIRRKPCENKDVGENIEEKDDIDMNNEVSEKDEKREMSSTKTTVVKNSVSSDDDKLDDDKLDDFVTSNKDGDDTLVDTVTSKKSNDESSTYFLDHDDLLLDDKAARYGTILLGAYSLFVLFVNGLIMFSRSSNKIDYMNTPIIQQISTDVKSLSELSKFTKLTKLSSIVEMDESIEENTLKIKKRFLENLLKRNVKKCPVGNEHFIGPHNVYGPRNLVKYGQEMMYGPLPKYPDSFVKEYKSSFSPREYNGNISRGLFGETFSHDVMYTTPTVSSYIGPYKPGYKVQTEERKDVIYLPYSGHLNSTRSVSNIPITLTPPPPPTSRSIIQLSSSSRLTQDAKAASLVHKSIKTTDLSKNLTNHIFSVAGKKKYVTGAFKLKGVINDKTKRWSLWPGDWVSGYSPNGWLRVGYAGKFEDGNSNILVGRVFPENAYKFGEKAKPLGGCTTFKLKRSNLQYFDSMNFHAEVTNGEVWEGSYTCFGIPTTAQIQIYSVEEGVHVTVPPFKILPKKHKEWSVGAIVTFKALMPNDKEKKSSEKKKKMSKKEKNFAAILPKETANPPSTLVLSRLV